MMKWKYFALAIGATFFLTGAAFASEQGSSTFWVLWNNGWRVINFIILLFLIVKMAKKPLGEFLAGRKDDISRDLSEAEEILQASEAEYDEIEKKIAELDTQVAGIKDLIENQGRKQKDKLIKDANSMSKRIIEEAKARSQFELNKARQKFTEDLVETAITIAEEKIREKITKKDQEKLILDYIKGIREAA